MNKPDHIIPARTYQAVIIGIEPITHMNKESVDYNSYRWQFRIVKGKYTGRTPYGLTPQNTWARGSRHSRGRLTEWLDVLKGSPMTDEAISKYANPSCPVPLEGLRAKYINDTIWKIRIVNKKHNQNQCFVDYRVSSIISKVED
jgi:hypothetical protein